MVSRGVSGSSNDNQAVVRIARMIAANPWVRLDSIIGNKPRQGRSAVEREILNLAESIGVDRHFSLVEVTGLLTRVLEESTAGRRLLVAPVDLLDHIPAGRQVKAIPNYLEEILRRAEHEVLLMAPFWDMVTLVDLLRCVPRERENVGLVLLLVQMGRRIPDAQSVVDEIRSACRLSRIQVYLHLLGQGGPTGYPHAKCLVVDRSQGYLGSANFTGRGMKGHVEVGVSLLPEDARTLGDILQHLWSRSDLFSLAWDSALTMHGIEEPPVQ